MPRKKKVVYKLLDDLEDVLYKLCLLRRLFAASETPTAKSHLRRVEIFIKRFEIGVSIARKAPVCNSMHCSSAAYVHTVVRAFEHMFMHNPKAIGGKTEPGLGICRELNVLLSRIRSNEYETPDYEYA